MKKTILIAMSKNYQKVELSLELDNVESIDPIQLSKLQTGLIDEAKLTLETTLNQLVTVEVLDASQKDTLEALHAPKTTGQTPATEWKKNPPYQTTNVVRDYQVINGCITKKQAQVLIKNNQTPSTMTYQDCKLALDKIFKRV